MIPRTFLTSHLKGKKEKRPRETQLAAHADPAAHTSDPGSVGDCDTRCPTVTGGLTSSATDISILRTHDHRLESSHRPMRTGLPPPCHVSKGRNLILSLRSCGSRGDEGEVTSKHVHKSTLCRRGGLSSTPQQHPCPPPEQHILPGRLHAQQDSRAFTEMLPCAIWLTTGPSSATTPNEPNCRHFLPRLLPERDLRSQSVSATRCIQIPRTPIVGSHY